MSAHVFALVDCNNFYASCERLFRPDLARAPIVVLSNNDGCIVARSQEVKDLGIKMGTPLFQAMPLIKQHGIEVFSSNYTLYGDISARVMLTLEALAPQVEVYSIDEAFLDLTGIAKPLNYGRMIRATVSKHVGVPVCVGIAPTKTLAKLANHAAKTYKATGGVVDLTDPKRQRRLMDITPVKEVWGVGRKLTQKLEQQGITTTLQLAEMDPHRVRQRYSVVMERTVRELNGESCLALEDVAPKRQQIVCSRSFGERLTAREDVKEAVCEFAARAAAKLRGEDQKVKVVQVFIRTSPFDKEGASYSNSVVGTLPQPSSDTRDILALAVRLFDVIWREGYRYAKAGIMLGDFCASEDMQFDLFSDQSLSQSSERLMQAIDQINSKGRNQVWFGGQRPQKDWFMRQGNISPAYTTRWECIPGVT